MTQFSMAVDLTPEQIATVFCDMDDHQQARFFNECGKQFGNFPNAYSREVPEHWNGDMQVSYLTSSEELTKDGVSFITSLADFCRIPCVSVPWETFREMFVERIMLDINK